MCSSASVPSASAESGQLIVRHAYPETDTNFTYIELTCLYEDPESRILAVGADFQLNGTDVEEELNVTDIGDGTIRFILTPENEGFFTCSLNGSLSNNSIGLASQPSTNYSREFQSHEVELPDADSVVRTELQCDIQPGALRQRYFVQWRQIFSDSYIIANERMFNLTLNVSSSQNGSQHQCQVTIDHDGSIIRSYDGVLTTLVTSTALVSPTTFNYVTAGLGAGIGTLLIFIFTIVTVAIYNLAKRHKIPYDRYRSRGLEHSSMISSSQDLEMSSMINPYQEPLPQQETNIESVQTSVLVATPWPLSKIATDSGHTTIVTGRFSVETSAATDTDGSISASYEHNMDCVREHAREESPQKSAVFAQSSETTVVPRDCRNESLRLYKRSSTTATLESANNQRSMTAAEPSSPIPASSTLAPQYISRFNRDNWRIERRHSEEDPQTTSQPENPFLPRYSDDPYNTAEHIPKWIEPVATLTDCTSDGRSYYDEHNDFCLEILEGAITEGERVTIDIGVALYGPFQYPEGLRPVSPVFWICARGRKNFRFLKPVKITIEHCLSLDRDTDTHSLGLTFLKAGHTLNSAGMYELHSADGAQEFQSDLSHGTLTTDHFCFLCINAKDDHETAKRNGYYLIRAHENPILARGIQVMEFFVTLKLKCCVETVKIQCRDKGYVFFYRSFLFNLNELEDSHGSLTINYKEPEMWNICLQSPRMISDENIVLDKKEMELMELMGNTDQYPARFRLELDGTDSTTKSKIKFEFTGATEELVIEVPLPKGYIEHYVIATVSVCVCMHVTVVNYDVQSPTSFASNVSRLQLSSVGSDTTLSNPPDLHDLLSEVADHIPTKWERVGTHLRLKYSQIQTFKCNDPLDSFSKVFDAWQRQFNAPHTLPYTWESMIDVLRRVKEHAVADALLEKLH